jgi:predicted RNase H-like nuclease (RuvC/YqgF family)
MGGIDRTTVIHSIKNINTMLEINQDPLYNSDFRERVKNMEDKIVDVLVNNFKEQQRYQTRAERKIYTLQNELNASNNMIRLLQEKLNRLEHPYMTA